MTNVFKELKEAYEPVLCCMICDEVVDRCDYFNDNEICGCCAVKYKVAECRGFMCDKVIGVGCHRLDDWLSGDYCYDCAPRCEMCNVLIVEGELYCSHCYEEDEDGSGSDTEVEEECFACGADEDTDEE